MDTDHWFEQYLLEDDQRDWAEEDYWRNRCPACESKHGRDEDCQDGQGPTIYSDGSPSYWPPKHRRPPKLRRLPKLSHLVDLAAPLFLGLYQWWADDPWARYLLRTTVSAIIASAIGLGLLVGYYTIVAAFWPAVVGR